MLTGALNVSVFVKAALLLKRRSVSILPEKKKKRKKLQTKHLQNSDLAAFKPFGDKAERTGINKRGSVLSFGGC